MIGAVKHITGGLVDGEGAGARGRIGNLPSVDGQGFGLEDVIAHGVSLNGVVVRR